MYVASPAMKSSERAVTDYLNSTKLSQMITNDMGQTTTLWKEVADSFVSNAIGGESAARKATSKL